MTFSCKWICLSALLGASLTYGADAPRTQAQAQLLDHAEFLCSNCFFGPSNYYYCLAVDNTILVGYQRTPALNFTDKSKNYLTEPRPRWGSWNPPQQTFSISYDDRHIWVTRPENPPPAKGVAGNVRGAFIWASHGESKTVQLRRNGKRDMFTNDRCRGVAPKAN